MAVHVLLADDHRMMREGLRLILERAPLVNKVDEVENGRLAVQAVETLHPDLVVMDVSMPDLNGIEATRKIKNQFPHVHVIGLSMLTDKRYVLGMLDAGAAAYVIKGAAASELVQAIEAVSQGKKFLSPEIADVVVKDCLSHNDPDGRRNNSTLGNREREALQLIAEGYSSKEIGIRMGISPVTVETHRRNIMKKLRIHSIAELTKYAIREGLTNIEG